MAHRHNPITPIRLYFCWNACPATNLASNSPRLPDWTKKLYQTKRVNLFFSSKILFDKTIRIYPGKNVYVRMNMSCIVFAYECRSLLLMPVLRFVVSKYMYVLWLKLLARFWNHNVLKEEINTYKYNEI